MKNYKPKIRYLEDYQVKALNNLGFYTPYISHRKEINKNTSDFQKNYGMCGGGFTLKINLQYYCFGDTHYKPYVKIKTPYDSWWSSLWEVNAFTEEIREFQEELNRDIGALITLGIIE